jgi:branched-subunit amino acid ABC-type transport system permease component
VPWNTILVAGVTVGSIYALYGLGITLIYKATRVPNFAHGAIGMFGAYVFFKTWERSQTAIRIKWVHLKVPFVKALSWQFVPPKLPMWASLLLALVVTGLLGLAIARLMRPLEHAPVVLTIVATLALSTIIVGFVSDWFSPNAEIVPQTVPEAYHHLGRFRFDNFSVAITAICLAIAIGFGIFFRRTNLGIAIRATADSREVSRLLGINANAVAAFAWAAGSMLAAIGAILISPRNSLDQVFLFVLIVAGFAAALFGGFTSLVGTFVGGLVLGIVSRAVIAAPWPAGVLRQMFTKAGTAEFVSFLVIVAVLMTRPKFIFKGVRVDEDSGVGIARLGGALGPEDMARRSLDRMGALPVILRDWTVGRFMLGGMVVAALLAVPIFAVSYWSTILASGAIYALLGLSVVVLTGWTGQISVAPLTFAGAGAWGAAIAAGHYHWPFFIAIPAAGLVGVPIALLIGIPALRLRGFFLAIATVAFALACETWVFTLPYLQNNNKVPRGILKTGYSQPTFYVAVLVAALLFAAVWNLSKTRVARALYAIRDSENTAISMGIDPIRYKLLAFVLSGFLAGMAGGLFGYLNRILYAPTFSYQFSLGFLLFAILAGVGEIFGAFLVGVFQVLPALFASQATGVNQAAVMFPAALAILTVLQYPNGLAAFYRRLVRPFHPSERVAWASADTGTAGLAAATAASLTEVDLSEVAEELAVTRG